MKSLYGSYKTPLFQHWLSDWPTCRNHPIMRCPLRCWAVNKADNPKIPGHYKGAVFAQRRGGQEGQLRVWGCGWQETVLSFSEPPWAASCALGGSTTSIPDMKGLWIFYHAGLDTELWSSRMLSACKYNLETPRDLSTPWMAGFLPRVHAEVKSTDLGKWVAC